MKSFLSELGLQGDQPMSVGVDNTAARDIAGVVGIALGDVDF